MLNIGGTYTPERIDNQIEAINHSAQQGDFPIRVPQTSKHTSISGDAAIIQMYLHWARISKNKRVFTGLEASNSQQIQDFVRTSWGLCLSMVTLKFFAIDSSSDITKKVRQNRNAILSQINERKLSSVLKGPVFAFLCADHYKYYSAHLYSDDTPHVVDEYKKLASKLLQYFAPNRKEIAGISDNIGSILHELIKNTHDHGTKEFEFINDGETKLERQLPVSLRGLVIRKVSFRNNVFHRDAKGADALKAFFLRFKGEKSKKRTAIYFSVFDMGSGYASSLSKTDVSDLTFEEEVDITKRCFVKNATVKTGKGYGEGLSLALEELRHIGGLLHLRTGRTSFYINPEKYNEKKPSTIQDCFAWHGDGQQIEHAKVTGTALTMILPI